MEVDIVEDEGNDGEGMVEVMRVFTSLTNSLFANLESAADGLEQLLFNILHLTGKYMEILVPRATGQQCADINKAFNKWLLGRTFYISCVPDLNSIHPLSKEVQLRVLHTLCVKGASFYSELHQQYCSMLVELIQYYEQTANSEHPSKLTLQYFTPDKIDIPAERLDLKAIYVEVKDFSQCCAVIEILLQLLSDSIPLHATANDLHLEYYNSFFHKTLHAFQHFNMHIKFAILSFFVNLMQNYDKSGLMKFNKTFPEIFHSLMLSVEGLLLALQGYYEHGEIDRDLLEKCNSEIAQLLLNTQHLLNNRNLDIIKSICTLVLNNKHSTVKVFSKDLKMACLNLAGELDVPLECVQIQTLNADEIDLISPYYELKLTTGLRINPTDFQSQLEENIFYKQILEEMLNVAKAVEDRAIDQFVISSQLEKCYAIMCILQRVQLSHERWTKQNDIGTSWKIISKINCKVILGCLQKLYESHIHKLKNDIKCFNTILDMLLGVIFFLKLPTSAELMLVFNLTCLQSKPDFSPQIMDLSEPFQMSMLKYLLVENVLLQTKLNDKWSSSVSVLVKRFTQSKSLESYIFIIDLSPFLVLNGVFTESKLIAEHLLPAFLTKDNKVQKALLAALPCLACLAFGNSAVALTTKADPPVGHVIFANPTFRINLVCNQCHNEDRRKTTPESFLLSFSESHVIISKIKAHVTNNTVNSAQKTLFEKFLSTKNYVDVDNNDFIRLLECFSNHDIFSEATVASIFKIKPVEDLIRVIRPFLTNVMSNDTTEEIRKDAIMNVITNSLVHHTKTSLESSDYHQRKYTLDCIREFGLTGIPRILLACSKLLVYFIMHPQNPLAEKATVYLKEICEAHDYSTNQVYHRYKKDLCKLFAACSVYNDQYFSASILKVLRAFGFGGLIDFISKDVHHFLPYLIPYSLKVKQISAMIEEIACLVQCSAADFLSERFPHVYTHIYLYESDDVAKKSFELIEQITKTTILNLIIRHHRLILMDLLLQYCSDPEKVLKACRYLACHDPDTSSKNINPNLSLSQIADFLQPRFLGVLAYFDNKLVNARVALSVKRKALQSFPDIMQLMGPKYLTPLRFKVLATLRSTLSLADEFPKMLAQAWSAFIHNIDGISLGPLLANLAVSLVQQLAYAPTEINKIFQYLVLGNENLLSAHIPDLFFLEESNISEHVKLVIRKHVEKTQPEEFLEKVKWYLRHLEQDIPDVKLYAYSCLNKLLKNNRQDIHKAVFGRNNIDPVIVQLLECLINGCRSGEAGVRLASGACLGQLGALETGLLPRRYVAPDRSPFAFSVSDDCFASTALIELTRAFQYEKDTKIMDNYALTIQEILKVYGISPTGDKKELWDSFPEHMHQIMQPLLSSRYFLAFPAQPKKSHPLFGSAHATSFIEWAYNWAGQLIPLMDSDGTRELLRSAYPSMKRDARTLLLFLPYMLLHAAMTPAHHQYVYEEMMQVIGSETSESQNDDHNISEKTRYKVLGPIGVTFDVTPSQTEDSNQLQNKCCKTVYTMLDFLNRWLLEWCHSKQHSIQSTNYRSVRQFVERFDKAAVSRGNLACRQAERALQYLEMHMQEQPAQLQALLPSLARIYAALEEPDALHGILTVKRSEPSLKELVLVQEATGRVQDAAFCYERLAQDGQLDRRGLQGMVECYLSLDQPFTAYRLLSERGDADRALSELAAEPLWRLGRWEQLEELVNTPVGGAAPAPAAPAESWGPLLGRVLLALRSGDRERFARCWRDGMRRLLAQAEHDAARDAGGGGVENMLALHIVTEAQHAEETLHRLKGLSDGASECARLSAGLLEAWRHRSCLVQSDARTLEPLLRCRRILLQQMQELLEPSHPRTAREFTPHIGELWLQSAKHARKAGIFQQAYTYILNAEQYRPPQLFVEKARMYRARGQHESAFTTLRRGLDDAFPDAERLTAQQSRICAKAKLLIATYNEEMSNVDTDLNLQHYREAVDAYRQWEKSLVCLGAYYEKVSSGEGGEARGGSRRLHALNSYGRALQHGHKYLYQSMPRMLSIWLDFDISEEGGSLTELAQMTDVIRTYSERLPLYLYLTAFSQIVSRICHPVKEVSQQLKAITVRLLAAYPQHSLWMMMCVMKSSYPQRARRCQDVLADPRLKEPRMLKFVHDFTQLAEKLIELCNKPVPTNTSTASVRTLVSTLPRLLSADGFSQIMMPIQQFCRIVLPSKATKQEERATYNVVAEPLVYISGVEDLVTILPSLQHPRKITLTGSDGKPYIIMLKPKDDLRKDFRLMEFNAVVNRFLHAAPETRRRRLYIRTYAVLPLNEECGLIEWVPHLVGFRPILLHIYKQKGILTNNRELKEMMCAAKDPVSRKLKVFQEQLLPRHPPVFHEWYRRVFSDPYSWYQARSAYIRTTAVMSMVGYILGLGDRHGENILFDSTNGDAVHVDFNCLFNKGEGFEWPERVPFRLTHNMETAMGPLGREGMFRKCCEATMRELRAQAAALMSVVAPFVYDPLVAWSRARALADSAGGGGERVNLQARQHLAHIRQRLSGTVRTKNKQVSAPLSPEGQVEHLLSEATSVENLCQMYLGWGPFL